MFENKFVSLPSHLKTIEPMEVHRGSRTMCNTETSKVISRTDPVIQVADNQLGAKFSTRMSTKSEEVAHICATSSDLIKLNEDNR